MTRAAPAWCAVAVLAASLVGCGGPAARLANSASPLPSPSTLPPKSQPAPVLGVGAATVAVSVATVWRNPSVVRGIDSPAVANPAQIRTWLESMSDDGKRGLDGRADTQSLLGDRVEVLAVEGGWAKVVVLDQPTPLDRRGYPGWIPTRQLVPGAPSARGSMLTVVSPTTWLRSSSGAASVEVGFGTRLRGIERAGDDWKVLLPGGSEALVSPSSVVVGSLAASQASLVSSARKFLGLYYLWAGAAAFGFDCSGLMEVVYRAHGIQIPRDADAQAGAGRPVDRSALQPGDLVFFADNGVIHHVGMYAGGGSMLHAPQTGAKVEITSISSGYFNASYVGARRYLAS